MAHAASEWSTDDVCAFLGGIGLSELCSTWAQPNKIDGAMLLDLIANGSLDKSLGDTPQAALQGGKIRSQLNRLANTREAWPATTAHQSAGSGSSHSTPSARPSTAPVQTPEKSKLALQQYSSPRTGSRTATVRSSEPFNYNSYLATAPTEIKRGDEVKSAGVLIVRRSSSGPKGIELLLPVEYKVQGRVLNILGGQDEPGDGGNPLHTAAREFYEETGHLLHEGKVRQMLAARAQRVYLGFGKYVLYVVRPAENSTFHKLHVRYNSTYSWVRGYGAEAEFLSWVPWHELQAAIGDSHTSDARVRVTHETQVIYLPSADTRRMETVRVSEFLRKAVASGVLTEAIQRALNEVGASSRGGEEDLRARLQAELATCQKLSALSDYEWLVQKLGASWQLKLKAPPKPPPFPISIVAPNGPEWKRILSAAKVPANLATRVVSVRECRVSARKAEYANEKAALERKHGTSVVQELRHPMHGTPERWRATAIAVNGFDLNITLHGRAAGNGVYSVLNDPSTPLGYTATSGSLLVMKALYTPDGLANKGTAPTDGNVLVFTNPKHVLPEAIVDFAGADQEADAITKLHAEQAAEIKRREEEHKAVRWRKA